MPITLVRRCWLLCLVFAGLSRTLDAQVDGYGLKSALLYNFVQFVEWPPSALGADDLLHVCVLDDGDMTRHFGALKGQRAHQRQLHVRGVSTPAEMASCHVVYVPEASAARTSELAARHEGRGMLFISDGPSDERAAAAIRLVPVGTRLVFDINLDAARSQKLTISSKLLKLARRVSDRSVATLHDQPGNRP